MKHILHILIFIGLVSSCTAGKPDNSLLEQALQASGGNRGELEKVLEHFSEDPADSLKLKAA